MTFRQLTWGDRGESNSRRSVPQTDVLPLNYEHHKYIIPYVGEISSPTSKIRAYIWVIYQISNYYKLFDVKYKNDKIGSTMTNKRVFSGIQPSGNLHIGNYLGALKRWADSQEDKEGIFCIVDSHAITVPQDPKVLRSKIRELAALYLAAGIDPKKNIIFVQSDVSAHAELGWILNCFTPMGWMERMTQFKDKSEKEGRERSSVGLFDYPVLMAADILLYDTDEVPVGEDQKQHVELTRDVAQKFNSTYGETFKLPEPAISQIGARIMSLVEPTKKMSKSDSNPNGYIYLLDTPDDIRSKIMKATTDSEGVVAFDEKRPGIYNLLEIYEILSGENRSNIEAKFAGLGYGDFKKDLAELVVKSLSPLQKKYEELIQNPEVLDGILKEGVDKARVIANKKLKVVKEKVGLGIS